MAFEGSDGIGADVVFEALRVSLRDGLRHAQGNQELYHDRVTPPRGLRQARAAGGEGNGTIGFGGNASYRLNRVRKQRSLDSIP